MLFCGGGMALRCEGGRGEQLGLASGQGGLAYKGPGGVDNNTKLLFL